MANRSDKRVEKFRKCNWCGSENTTEVNCGQDEESLRYVYFGWCHSCKDVYDYCLDVVTIWDNQGRI
jgi:hypothetical protein